MIERGKPPRLLALLTMALLAACGGTATVSGQPGAPGAASAKAAASVGAVGSAGAAQSWDDIVAAATKEGKLSIAVPPGPQYQPAIREAFAKTYPGIVLTMTNIIGGEFRTRITKERAAGEYDWDACICGPGADTFSLAHDGVYDPLRQDIALPEDLDDSKWLGGFNGRFSDSAKKFVFDFAANNSHTLFFNRDFVSTEVVASYEDFWKPELKGKFVWQDPRGPGSGVNMATLILHLKGEQALRDLWTSQQVLPSADDRQIADWLARGTHPIAVGVVPNRGLDLLQAQGLGKNVQPLANPVALSVPGAHSVQAVNKPPHPNARKLFLNWLLSVDGQTTLAKAATVNSARLDVPPLVPDEAVPSGVQPVNPQSEDWVPERTKAGDVARQIFK